MKNLLTEKEIYDLIKNGDKIYKKQQEERDKFLNDPKNKKKIEQIKKTLKDAEIEYKLQVDTK